MVVALNARMAGWALEMVLPRNAHPRLLMALTLWHVFDLSRTFIKSRWGQSYAIPPHHAINVCNGQDQVQLRAWCPEITRA